jgi:hypothetical protein
MAEVDRNGGQHWFCLVLVNGDADWRHASGGPALFLVVKKTPLTDVTSGGAVGLARPTTCIVVPCSARCVALRCVTLIDGGESF